MARVLLFFLALMCTVVTPSSLGRSRDLPALFPDKPQRSSIIGGISAPPHLYGWMISLQRNFTNDEGDEEWNHICGGSLITDRLILTAAHCIFTRDAKDGPPRLTNPEELKVVVGIKDLNSSYAIDHEMAVELIIPHRDFDAADTQMANDIAVIRLECSVTYLSTLLNVETINLPDEKDKSANSPTPLMSEYLIMGWGLTARKTSDIAKDQEHVDEKSSKLQVASSSLIDLVACQNIWRGVIHVTNALICTDSSITDVCQGDSGGPLIQRYLLPDDTQWKHRIVGLASFSSSRCGRVGQAAMFTAIEHHLLDFIKPNMEQTRKLSSTRVKKCNRMHEHTYTGKFKQLLSTFRRNKSTARRSSL